MLAAGQPAPPFSLLDADMEPVELASFRGEKHVVLYFYPKDFGPGCTTEAIEFSDIAEEFARAGAVVIGVSTDDSLRHAEFRDEHGIAVDLLADVDGDVCRQYGVLHAREGNGQVRQCVQRSTFVIDKSGVVRHALCGVNPKGHAREVLALVKKL